MVEMPHTPTPTDLKINVGDTQFKYRVSALVLDGGSLLTTTRPGNHDCYLPGGKVRLGESSREAMRRELGEELGHDLPVSDPVLVAEYLYDRAGLHHQLVFYFRIHVPAHLSAADLIAHPEEGHELRWIPIGELRAEGFRPADIIDELSALGGPLRHLVLDHRP